MALRMPCPPLGGRRAHHHGSYFLNGQARSPGDAVDIARGHVVLQEEGGSDVSGTFESEGGVIRFVPSVPLTEGAT